MTPFLNETIAIAVAALMGVAAGMWMRQGGFRFSDTTEKQKGDSKLDLAEELISKADEFLIRLQDLTVEVQSDVDGHALVIRKINQDLKDSHGPNSGQSVIEAISRIIDANDSMQEQLRTADLKLQHQARQLEDHVVDARFDGLTGLLNRRVFETEIEDCIREAESGRAASLMLLDIDAFKKVNARYGYQVGDDLLKQVASVLQKNLSERESVFRYSDDIFAVIFSGSDLSVARNAAERARDAVGDLGIEVEKEEVWVTASAGLAAVDENDRVRDIVHRANLALYASKDAGRDCGHWMDDDKIAPFRAKHTENEDDSGLPSSGGTESAIEELAPQEIEVDSANEELTWEGVSDRESFMGDVNRRLAAWRRGGEPLAVMLIRMDHHDQVEQEHGRESVDQALLTIVHVLRAQLREMDHIARFSDSVLGIVLPNIDQDSAILVGERIRLKLAQLIFNLGGSRRELSVSIGLIESMKGHESAEKLVSQADAALELAVCRGGNRTFVHSGKRVEQVFVLVPDAELPSEEENSTAV